MHCTSVQEAFFFEAYFFYNTCALYKCTKGVLIRSRIFLQDTCIVQVYKKSLNFKLIFIQNTSILQEYKRSSYLTLDFSTSALYKCIIWSWIFQQYLCITQMHIEVVSGWRQIGKVEFSFVDMYRTVVWRWSERRWNFSIVIVYCTQSPYYIVQMYSRSIFHVVLRIYVHSSHLSTY